MRYARIEKCECTNGLSWGMSLYTQGCRRKCKGCFNSSTWDFRGGEYFSSNQTEEILVELAANSHLKRFSILGGEPLEEENLRDVALLISRIRPINKNLKIWIFTGFTWEDLYKRIADDPNSYLTTILENIDVLVDGPFIQEQKDLSLKFAGSSNQRVIDVQKTLCRNEICLLDI